MPLKSENLFLETVDPCKNECYNYSSLSSGLLESELFLCLNLQ